MNKKNKLITGICFAVVAVLFLVLGIMILPSVSDLGKKILYYVVAAVIAFYIFCYLVPLAVRLRGTRQILTVIEIVIDGIITIALAFSKLIPFIQISQAMMAVSIVLWLHAAFAIMRGFFIVKYDAKKYPFYVLVIDLVIISVAAMLFFQPPLTDNTLVLLTAIACFIGCAVTGILSVLIFNGKYTFKLFKKTSKSKK